MNERVEQRLRLAVEMKGVVRELTLLLRLRRTMLALILMLLPIGSGGAQNLWAAIAGDWRASADQVALVNGAMGGVASLVGTLIGGWLCDRIDRRFAYCLFGLVVAAAAGVMALLPRTRDVFIALTLATLSLSAHAMPPTRRSCSRRSSKKPPRPSSSFAAASNVPIALMTTWDGRLQDWMGAGGMLAGEVVFCVVGIALFAAAFLISHRLEIRKFEVTN